MALDFDLTTLDGVGLSAGGFCATVSVNDNGDGTYTITDPVVFSVGQAASDSSREPFEFHVTSNGDNTYGISISSQYLDGQPNPSGVVYFIAPGDTGPMEVTGYNDHSILMHDTFNDIYYVITTENVFANGTADTPQLNDLEFGNTGPIPPFQTAVPPCFASGTHIATPEGNVAVESLKVGDMVFTASGEARAIRWIGRSRVQCQRHSRPWEVMPIRIQAHAFGSNLPVRDLIVSPGHAIYVDGVLIPAGCLINGATVVQETVETINYHHVELDSHDILLAEGLPCESYLDDGNRHAFNNAGEHVALHGRLDPQSWENAYAPCVMAGPQVVEVRQRLLDRALVLGYCREEGGDLHLVVDGKRVDSLHTHGQRNWFVVPAGAREVRLASRSAILAQMCADLPDSRTLGACVSDIRIDGQAVALDGDVLTEGCYPLETQGGMPWRWTNGNARLVVASGSMPMMIEVAVVMQMVTWRKPVLEMVKAA